MLAEGYAAKGRMPEPGAIVAWIKNFTEQQNVLQGKNIVITAGGTEEAIDPVRFIGNRSSGKMGISLATEAAAMGAKVKLIYGNVSMPLPLC